MQHEVVVAWLAGLFGLMAVTLAIAAALVSWAALSLALPLGATALLLWYHASGRLRERMEQRAYRRRVGRQRRDPRRTASAGVGPAAAGASDPSSSAGRRRERRSARQARAARRAAGRQRASARSGPSGGGAAAAQRPDMTRQRALSVLDLDAGADGAAVRAAYRSKVKETHPDRGGDADAFMQVTEAYERLGGDS